MTIEGQELKDGKIIPFAELKQKEKVPDLLPDFNPDVNQVSRRASDTICSNKTNDIGTSRQVGTLYEPPKNVTVSHEPLVKLGLRQWPVFYVTITPYRDASTIFYNPLNGYIYASNMEHAIEIVDSIIVEYDLEDVSTNVTYAGMGWLYS